MGMTTRRDESNSVFVPQLAWWGDIETELTFPKGWEVAEYRMNGHDAPPLDDAGFRKAFANPTDSPRTVSYTHLTLPTGTLVH